MARQVWECGGWLEGIGAGVVRGLLTHPPVHTPRTW